MLNALPTGTLSRPFPLLLPFTLFASPLSSAPGRSHARMPPPWIEPAGALNTFNVLYYIILALPRAMLLH